MMSLIQERTMEVRELSEELSKRLAPVRRTDPPTPTAPDQSRPQEANTPLTGLMIDHVISLKMSIDQLTTILRTLEL